MSFETVNNIKPKTSDVDKNRNNELQLFSKKSPDIISNAEITANEDIEFKLLSQNTQEKVNNAGKIKTITDDQELKFFSLYTKDNASNEIKVETTNKGKQSKLFPKSIQRDMVEKTYDKDLISQNTQERLNNADKLETLTIVDIELKLFSNNTQERISNADKVEKTTNEYKESKLCLKNIQESLSNTEKVETTTNEDIELKLSPQNTQEIINNMDKVQKTPEVIDSKLFLQNSQETINKLDTEAITTEEKELKLISQNKQEKLADALVEISTNKDKKSLTYLNNGQDKIANADRLETSTHVDKELHLISKKAQERDNKFKGNESKGNLLLKNNDANNDKFLILIKNLPKSFHNIKQNIKQIVSTKVRNYKTKRKEKKEAKKLEKERLKKIPKTLNKSINQTKISEEQEWFRNQYERYIGMPKMIKETNPSFVLGYLRMKACCRYVPEAKELWCKSKPKPKDSVFLTWNGPPLSTCMCPYKECFCRGDMVIEAKRIPCGCRYDWNPMYYLQMLCCYRIFMPKSCTKDFINKLVTITNDEGKRYETLYRTGALNQMPPELCLLRCQHYGVPDDNRTIKYLPIEFIKPDQVTVKEEDCIKKIETIENENDDRICNAYSCTVSSQTNTGPDGEIIIGKVSHFIFASIKDSVLSDVEGKRLQISPYKRGFKVPDSQVCVRTMENLFNMKEIKSRISKLISSIIEIKDPGIPISTRATQIPSCSQFCDGTEKHKGCNTSKLEMPWLRNINKLNNVDDQSSCVCCKLYKESFNINATKNN